MKQFHIFDVLQDVSDTSRRGVITGNVFNYGDYHQDEDNAVDGA